MATTSIGTVLATFRVTKDPNSAWRKMPDWSGSLNVSRAFAESVGNTQLIAADTAAKLAAMQGLQRIRTLAAAKTKAAQDEAASRLQAAIDASNVPKGSTTVPGPKFSTSSSAPATSSSTGVSGPRYSFTV
jgi:hypothetical protein